MEYLIALAAAVARLLSVRMQGTGWLDELISLRLASMPLSESMALATLDVHPPLWHLLLTGWLAVFGDSLSAARVLSLAFGVAAVGATWLMARESVGRDGAPLAALLVALSPALVLHSGEARMYPLLVTLSALSLWLLVRSDRRSYRWSDLLAWSLASAAALMTHLIFLPSFIVAAAWGFLRAGATTGGRFRLAVSALFAVLPLAVWSPFLLSRLSSGGEWQSSVVPEVGSLFSAASGLLALGSGPVIGVLALAAAAVLVMSAESAHGRTADRTNRLLLLQAVVPFAVLFPFGNPAVKYHLVALPAVAGLLAAGVVRLGRRLDRPGTVRAASVAILLLAVLPALALQFTGRRVRWDEAMLFVQSRERPGDVMLAEWFASELPISEYYRGNLPVESGYPFDDTLPPDERLLLHAGQAVVSPELLEDVERASAGAERVFLVTGLYRPDANPVQAWFPENGWRLVDMYETNSFSPTVLLFERADR